MTKKQRPLPKIIIKYNRFLDPIFIFYCKNNPELKNRGWNGWTPPAKHELQERIESYKTEWEKESSKIILGMCEVLGLSFQRNIIDVYIVSGLPRGLVERGRLLKK